MQAQASARATAALVAVAGLGIAALLLATRWGVGLTPDSAEYLKAARSLASGHGLGLEGGEAPRPLVATAPLFPAVVGGLIALGLPPRSAVRALHALLFGGAVLGMGLVLRRGTRSLWIPLLGAFLLATSEEALRVFARVLSEPLAIVWGSLGLVLLGRHLDAPSRGRLLLAAAATALALLARYAAAPYAATGVLALLLQRAPLRRRLAEAAGFGAAAFGPLALWLARNLATAGRATDREIAWHPIGGPQLDQAWETLLRWLAVEGRASAWLAGALALALVGALVAHRLRGGGIAPELRSPIRLAGLFIGVTLAFLAAAISLFDAQVRLRFRILAPVQLALLPLVLWLLAASAPRRPRTWTAALAILGLLFASLHAARGFRFAAQAFRDGTGGYATRAWAASETLAQVRELPAGAQIYSNAPDAIWLLADREARWVPKRIDVRSRQRSATLREDWGRLRRDLRSPDARLVWLDRVPWRKYLLPEERLVKALGLVPVAETSDGTIYAAAPRPGEP